MNTPIPTLPAERWDDFFAELDAIGREAGEQVGQDDVRHLLRMQRWGRIFSTIGYATAWLAPNPVSAICIGQGIMARWLLMHHIGHQAYDKIDGIDPRLTSARFGIGRRRWLDWPEWMLPEAWNYEHNRLHHHNLNEVGDPDLLQRNAAWLRERPVPRVVAWLIIAFVMMTWKFFYYAPNTLAELRDRQAIDRNTVRRSPIGRRVEGADVGAAYARRHFGTLSRWDVWKTCILPYAVLRFGVIPAVFLPLGVWAWASVLINSVIAEVVANVHSFVVIVPNHAGEDMPSFEQPTSSWRENQVRQIIGSVNYRTGGDANDFAHMWLNYQIEHHVWPRLTMRGYQRVQPELRALCERYGIPYVQQSVFTRLRRTLEIVLGDAVMPHFDGQVVPPAAQRAARRHQTALGAAAE